MYFYIYETNREEEVHYNIADGCIENSGLDYEFEYHLEYSNNSIKKLKVWNEKTNDVLFLMSDDKWECGVDSLLKLQVFTGLNIKYNLNKNILEDDPKNLESEAKVWMQAMAFLLSRNLGEIKEKSLSEIGLCTNEDKKQLINLAKKLALKDCEEMYKTSFKNNEL